MSSSGAAGFVVNPTRFAATGQGTPTTIAHGASGKPPFGARLTVGKPTLIELTAGKVTLLDKGLWCVQVTMNWSATAAATGSFAAQLLCSVTEPTLVYNVHAILGGGGGKGVSFQIVAALPGGTVWTLTVENNDATHSGAFTNSGANFLKLA